MSRYFVLLLSILLLAGLAAADPVGPIPPAGWGLDCVNWIDMQDPWSSGEIIYDPLLGAGGDGWRMCPSCDPLVWPDLYIELWIEMECVITWNATHAKIHRVSDYNDFYLYFSGTSACNNGQYIITTPPTGLATGLTVLPFVQDMFGRTGPQYGTDIPLTWEYSVDGGPWTPMILDGDNLMFLVDACDHSFTIRIFVDQEYHQEDGYYFLGGPGCKICPATPL